MKVNAERCGKKEEGGASEKVRVKRTLDDKNKEGDSGEMRKHIECRDRGGKGERKKKEVKSVDAKGY